MGSLARFNLKSIRKAFDLHTLVETGTGMGNSLACAAHAGFSELHSVEQVPQLFESCRQRFSSEPRVCVHFGDSVAFLREMVARKLPHVFYFLDAHFVGGADFGLVSYTESASKEESYPLLAELAILLEADLSSSAIVIDDARMYFADAFQSGACPEFARRWQDKEKLLALLGRLDATHSSNILREDEGYLIIAPKAVPFDKYRWLFIRAGDSSGAVQFVPGVPGATSISIHRRLADSRFATRYFRGHGIDVGGGQDSLTLYREFFPLVGSVFTYDRPMVTHRSWTTYRTTPSTSCFPPTVSSTCVTQGKHSSTGFASWRQAVISLSASQMKISTNRESGLAALMATISSPSRSQKTSPGRQFPSTSSIYSANSDAKWRSCRSPALTSAIASTACLAPSTRPALPWLKVPLSSYYGSDAPRNAPAEP
jgi:hypothetical protein